MAIKKEPIEACVAAQSQLYAQVLGGESQDYQPVSKMLVQLYKKFRQLEQDHVETLTAAQRQQFSNDAQESANILNAFVQRAQAAFADQPANQQMTDEIESMPIRRNRI